MSAIPNGALIENFELSVTRICLRMPVWTPLVLAVGWLGFCFWKV